MKKALKIYLLFALSFLFVSTAQSQPRRSQAQVRSAVAQKIGADRAARLRVVHETDVVGVLSDSIGGFAVVGYNPDFPAVLGYGDGYIDMENPSPEFLYLLDLYEQALLTSEDEAAATRAKAPVKASTINVNISPLLGTTWSQRSPYNLRSPMSGGKHTMAGCVAVAFAQVFKFYERPKKMHGYRRYHFNNDSNQREFCDYDFSAVSFDWGNMPKKLKDDGFLGIGNTSATQNNAVSELIYAAGVLSSMDFGINGSGAATGNAAYCIDEACEDLSASYTQYEDVLVMDELREGRPVVYAGFKEDSSGHCFVIDGCRSDGYLHCNLGWDGTDDGYYLPTDMQGWKFYQDIVIVRPADGPTTCTPLPELANRTVRANRTAATTIEPNRWYTLWNSGRCSSPSTKGVGSAVTNVGTIPAGETTEICAGQLVRFIPAADGQYYIQTAIGDYWNTFVQSGSRRTTAEPQQAFTVGTIQSGYFYMKSGNVTVDSDGIGAGVVGWGTSTPSDIYSNASWQIFPVELGYNPNETPTFDPDQTYVIKNVGYSQGYLVATDTEDYPTLRGVTNDHPDQGLYQGALYHNAPDFYNLNSFWYVKTSNGRFYLVNAGKKQGLSNSGDKTVYTFSSEAKPINITVGADGYYRLNSGTQAESFLCAATHLQNPAAFWTTDDNGSKWTIEPMEPYVRVESIAFDDEEVKGYVGNTLTLHVNVLPAAARDKSCRWTSSNTAVATVSESGVVTFVAAGDAVITASSADNPFAYARIRVHVIGAVAITSLSAVAEDAVYMLQNTSASGYSGGYLVALTADDANPTLRGVTVAHSQGCKDVYKADVDMSSPGTCWQLLSDGSSYYLYNALTQKFLTNEGDARPYAFTDRVVPINVTVESDGSFRFNAGTNDLSYLCAATQFDNPAANWDSSDAGSRWIVKRVEEPAAEPTDFFVVTNATISRLTREINKASGTGTSLSIIERIARAILRKK